MATEVDIDITDIAVIRALNTPGGAAYEWRDETANDVVRRAIATSPVNDPLNAVHRGGLVGTYKASWGWDRVGSNGHIVRATIYNGADHADLVEFGRRPSHGYERFSWTRWGGEIRAVRSGTRGYPGKHILRNAVNAALRGVATPLS